VTVQPSVASEVGELDWTGAGKDTITWTALPNAASYRLFRVSRQICRAFSIQTRIRDRFDGTETTTGPVLTDDPAAAAGGLYWYLVVGVGCSGDGPVGNASAGHGSSTPRDPARSTTQR